MRHEWTRQGDAIAAPIHRWFDRDDGNFEGFGGQSWNQVDGQPKDGSAAWRAENEQANLVYRTTWSTLITSIFAELWSKILRQRETHHIRAAWEMIDDRTLKDIGISRNEIERGGDARHWS